MNDNEKQLMNSMNHEIGELKGHMIRLDEKIGTNHEVHVSNAIKIDKILEQTTKTNGRVNNLEEVHKEQVKFNSKIDGLYTKLWEEQSFLKGAWKVLAIIGAILVVVGGYIFTLVIKDITHTQIKEALAEYDIIVR